MSKPAFTKIRACIAFFVLVATASWLTFMPAGRKSVTKLPGSAKALTALAVGVPAGTYPVGSREANCYTPLDVEITAFSIMPFETPASWWNTYTGDPKPGNPALPATGISYDEAVTFCGWLSEKLNVRARLPTRSEWEVAARSGKGGVTYSWGWEHKAGSESIQPVLTGQPNPWGLFNMSGNVAEWCLGLPGDPSAPVMGGSWAERDPRYLRVSNKLLLPKTYSDADVGFRIVIEAPER